MLHSSNQFYSPSSFNHSHFPHTFLNAKAVLQINAVVLFAAPILKLHSHNAATIAV
jgi:hypothetical protein